LDWSIVPIAPRLQAKSDREYTRAMPHSNLVAVKAFAMQIDADLAKSVLESAGIDAMIQSDRAGGMRDHLAWSGFGFKVLVREEDARAAREFLESASEEIAQHGEDITVAEFRTEAEAESAMAALISAGIYSAVQASTAGGISSTLGLERFRVQVSADDAPRAREILKPRTNAAPRSTL
jgi:activator of HSP90 ATPase